MEIVGAYSFKGGTGRTTALSNIAASLANMGRNVCLLDLDIEGPGLSVVLKEGPKSNSLSIGASSSASEEYLCIQDYFKSKNPEEFNIEDMVLDIKSKKVGKERGWGDMKGNFHLIPARMEIEKKSLVDYRKIEEDGKRRKRKPEEEIQSLLNNLVNKLENKFNLDFLLIDSASGYGDVSALTMYVSDLVLVFFRWSRQHLNGTVIVSEFFKRLEDRGRDIEHEFIANSVPYSLFKGKRKHEFEQITKYLEEVVEKEIFAALPENDELKWNERILIFDEDPDNKEIIEKFEEIAIDIDKRF